LGHAETKKGIRNVGFSVTDRLNSTDGTWLAASYVGLFCENHYLEVSAVIYSSQATWGKVRAPANDPLNLTAYTTTLHTNLGELFPVVRAVLKRDYSEHLIEWTFRPAQPSCEAPDSARLFE
jgi:hypothetical protein